MRLTCPHCSTEYEVPDVALAAGSRRLRCDRCGHQWRQETTDAAPPDEAPQPVAPAPELAKPDRVTPGNLPKFLTKRDPQSDLAEGADDRAVTERRRGIGVESQPRRPVRRRRGPRGRILLLLALIVIAAAVFMYRSF